MPLSSLVPSKRRLFVVAAFATAVPQIVFFAGVAPYFCADKAPRGWSVLAVGIFLAVCAWTCFLVAAFTDPGWVPYSAEHEKELLYREASTGLPMNIRVRDRKTGEEFSLKYCENCRVFRPPRTKHCYVCERCCVRLDHHCVWLGQCVGARNHPYFLGYLISILLLLVYGVVVCFLEIGFESEQLGNGISGFRAALVHRPFPAILALLVGVYCLFVGGFIAALYLVQLFFACTGRTTAEACGRAPIKRGSRIGIAGLAEVLCIAPQDSKKICDRNGRNGAKFVWQYEFLGLEYHEQMISSLKEDKSIVSNAVYDERWSEFEKLRHIPVIVSQSPDRGTASDTSVSQKSLAEWLDRYELMLLRRWIMEGMPERCPQDTPEGGELEAASERKHLELVRAFIHGERASATMSDLEDIRRMLVLWREQICQKRNLPGTVQSGAELATITAATGARGDPEALPEIAAAGLHQSRVVCSSFHGRVEITNTCGA